MNLSQSDSLHLPNLRRDEKEKEYGFAGFPEQKLFLIAGDITAIVLSVALFLLRDAGMAGTLSLSLWSLFATASACLLCYLSALYIFDMYNIERSFNVNEAAKRCFCAVLLGSLLFTLLLFNEGATLTKTVMLTILLWAFFTGWRRLYSSITKTSIARKAVLIIGAGEGGQAIYDLLSSPASPYAVKGFVDDISDSMTDEKQKIIGSSDRLAEVAHETGANSAILTTSAQRSPGFTRNVLEARLKGTKIQGMADVYEQLTRRIPISYIKDDWFLSAEGFHILDRAYIRRLKRLCDLAVSALLLLLAFPLIVLAAVLIRFDSPGPVLYEQERVGRRGKPFKIYKFRSMTVDAERNGAQWAAANDPRVTRVGKWLRLSRVDELPQLWNVLKGDMSLVGPRPERPHFVSMLEENLPYYGVRHYVKPGLTGWAQVTFRYGASMEDSLKKLEADVYYVKNMSLFLDLRILLKTVGVVFLGQGAR
jgi:sugar transferase (PEP-CTERM system associated)